MADLPQDPNTPLFGTLIGPTVGGSGSNTATPTSILDPVTGLAAPYQPPQVDPNAPQQSTPKIDSFDPILRFKSVVGQPETVREDLAHNPLNDYVDVIHNITFGMISWNAWQRVQSANIYPSSLSPGSDYIVFASTGDVATDPSYTGDYYNIKSFIFNNFFGHIPQNPMVARFLDGKMTMVQPYGFSFREDMDDLAVGQLGYDMPLPLEYTYRVEISFSGYKPTGEWVKRIPFPISADRNRDSIIYYLKVTTAEAQVNPTGSVYTLSFVDCSTLATRAETIMLHQDNMPTGDKTLEYKAGSKFKFFLGELAEKLKKQISYDTQGYVNVDYEFIGPDYLMNAEFTEKGNIDFHSGVSYNDDSGSYVFSGNSVDIFTLINHVLNALPIVRDLLLREDNPRFTEPGQLWNIRPRIAEVSNPDPKVTNRYLNYSFVYYIEPVQSFRFRQTEVEQRNDRVDRGAQIERANYMLNNGMLVRIYNYIFTNDNTEIIDFQFRYKNFYYDQFPYADNYHAREASHMTNDRDFQKQNSQDQLTHNEEDAAGVPPEAPSTVTRGSGSGLDVTQLGIPISPQSANNTVSPVSIQQGMDRGPHHPQAQHMGQNPRKAQKYMKNKDQYLRFDMLDCQMTVRLDPLWLLNPYMAGNDYTPTTESSGGTLMIHLDRVLLIQTFGPNQKNYMSPDFAFTQPKREPILGGFYQVLTATTELEGGKMVQKLNLIKYTHLNYLNSIGGNNAGIRSGDFSQTPGSSGGGVATPDPNPRSL